MWSSEIKKRSSTHPGSELQLLLLEYSFGVLKSDPNQIKSRPMNRFRLIQLAPYFWFFRPALLITSRRQDGPRGSNHRQPYLSSRPISCDDDPFHPYAMMILNHIHIWYGHGGFLSHGATPSSHPIFGIFHENQAQRAETAALYLRATSWSIWPGISWI